MLTRFSFQSRDSIEPPKHSWVVHTHTPDFQGVSDTFAITSCASKTEILFHCKIMISLQNNLDPTSSLIGQKLIVYCIAKPVKNLNILGLVLSLFHRSKRLHSPSDNERNNTFEMLEEYEESF